MSIQLSDHFNYKKIIRFTLPSIAMMIFMSIYGVVDGFFVSNYAGKTPFAAVLILPIILGINGVWMSIVVAEFMAVVFGFLFMILKCKKYNY